MRISLFERDTAADASTVVDGTWSQFVAGLARPHAADTPKRELPMWSPAVFRDGHRAAANVESVSALCFDVDEQPVPSRADLEALPFRGVVTSSPSATAAAPRWRLVLALSRPVTGDEYRRAWSAVAEALPFPVGQASKDPSRAWYLSKVGADGYFEAFEVPGEPLDVDELLAVAPTPVAPAPAAPVSPAPDDLTRALAAKRAAAALLLGKAWPAKGRHAAQLALAGALRRDGWSPDEALEFLCAVCREVGDEDRAKREATIRSTWGTTAPTTGWTTLGRCVGAGVSESVRALLDVDAELWAQVSVPPPAPVVEPVEPVEAAPAGFPVEVLPPVLRDFAEAEALSTQTPVEVAAMLALAACSAGLSGKAQIDNGQWREKHAGLFVVVAMESGSRKSPVYEAAFGPVKAAERAKVQATAARRNEIVLERARCEKLVKAKTADYEKLDPNEVEQEWTAAGTPGGLAIKRETLALQMRLDADLKAPVEPRLLTDDVTMEALGYLLQRYDGRMCIASPEGERIFGIAGGHYSGAASFGPLLKGYSGEQIVIDRVATDRPAVNVPEAYVTLAVTLQPRVLGDILGNDAFVELGLLARCFCVRARANVGYRAARRADKQRTPPHVADAYARLVARLFDIPTPAEGAMPVLEMSVEAQALFDELAVHVEEGRRPGGVFDRPELGNEWDTWISKLCGGVTRLAGVLHAVEHGLTGPISAETLERAIALGEYLIGATERTFAEGVSSAADQDANTLIAWAKKRPGGTFTSVDAYRGPRCMRSKERHKAALQLAVLRGDIVETSNGWRLVR